MQKEIVSAKTKSQARVPKHEYNYPIKDNVKSSIFKPPKNRRKISLNWLAEKRSFFLFFRQVWLKHYPEH